MPCMSESLQIPWNENSMKPFSVRSRTKVNIASRMEWFVMEPKVPIGTTKQRQIRYPTANIFHCPEGMEEPWQYNASSRWQWLISTSASQKLRYMTKSEHGRAQAPNPCYFQLDLSANGRLGLFEPIVALRVLRDNEATNLCRCFMARVGALV
jgi:hypothetical protein